MRQILGIVLLDFCHGVRQPQLDAAFSATTLAQHSMVSESFRRLTRLSTATILVGITSGLGGMGLALLLRLVQHLSFGYQLHPLFGETSFLVGVSDAGPTHRFMVLLACGVVAGLGWWLVYRFLRPVVSIRQAVKNVNDPMPVGSTVAHSLLQIVTVGMGSPLGREVAPRELGSLFATLLGRAFHLDDADRRVMIACGAGAGLAAVYNVPLAGAIFTLEVLLNTFALPVVIPAVASAVVAAVVAWIGLGDRTQYQLPPMDISAPLIAFAIVTGPLFGYAGYCYGRLGVLLRKQAPRDWRLLPWCLASFATIGVAAMWYPELLGNGRGPVQLALDSDIPVQLAIALLVLKLCATTAALRAGAEGGLLTPGLSMGALLATLLGAVWNCMGAGVSPGSFALIGATAFLASSMSMPVTAVALAVEFTGVGHDFLIPILCAVAGSVAIRRLSGD